MNADDRVLAVVLAAKHFLGFGAFDGGLKIVETPDQVRGDVLALTGPLDEDAQILDAPLQRIADGGVFLDPAPALQDFLRLALILPEVGLGDPGLELGDLPRRVGGVKDTSGDPRPAWSALRSAGRVHQERLPYSSRSVGQDISTHDGGPRRSAPTPSMRSLCTQ